MYVHINITESGAQSVSISFLIFECLLSEVLL